MGIQGLLHALRPITINAHIGDAKFTNKRCAVDASAWLHRASYGCARELCLGKPTTQYVKFCVEMVKLLQAHKITPVIVFDGASLPMKASTNQTRRASREHNLNKGKTHFEAGQFREADECFQRAVKVTSKMCRALQLELNRMSIEFIVAPYEADAQMAYCQRTGYVDFCITEDSDLLTFGVTQMLVKLDRTGACQHINLFDIVHCDADGRSCAPQQIALVTDKHASDSPHNVSSSFSSAASDSFAASSPASFVSDSSISSPMLDASMTRSNSVPSFSTPTNASASFSTPRPTHSDKFILQFNALSHKQFVFVCALAGCDYCDSLPGVALKTAIKLVGTVQGRSLTTLITSLERDKQPPPTWRSTFVRAVLTFVHQRVWNPVQRCLTHLTPLNAETTEWLKLIATDDEKSNSLSFLGDELDPQVAFDLCTGIVDPKTLVPFPKPAPQSMSNKTTGSHPSHQTLAKSATMPITQAFSVGNRASTQNFSSKPMCFVVSASTKTTAHAPTASVFVIPPPPRSALTTAKIVASSSVTISAEAAQNSEETQSTPSKRRRKNAITPPVSDLKAQIEPSKQSFMYQSNELISPVLASPPRSTRTSLHVSLQAIGSQLTSKSASLLTPPPFCYDEDVVEPESEAPEASQHEEQHASAIHTNSVSANAKRSFTAPRPIDLCSASVKPTATPTPSSSSHSIFSNAKSRNLKVGAGKSTAPIKNQPTIDNMFAKKSPGKTRAINALTSSSSTSINCANQTSALFSVLSKRENAISIEDD